MRFGVDGLLSGITPPDLLRIPARRMEGIAASPGSFIGSSRRRLTEPGEYDLLAASLRKHDIRTLFYTGGNGSMAAALAIAGRFPNLQIVGIPKTIDNDLRVTDHTPGYASTAYFFACAARDAGIDNQSLPSPVCVLETLGRDVGWIVAATALARNTTDAAPHLIYFAEHPLTLDRIAADVERVYRRLGRAFVAVCEGQFDGQELARELTARLGIRARAERPGLVGRSCGPFTRDRDCREAFECGRAAVRAALHDETGVMVALHHDSSTFLTPLTTVAGKHRNFPLEWIAEGGNDVRPEFLRYAEPLVGVVPAYETVW